MHDTHSCTVGLFHGTACDFALNIDNHGVAIGLRFVSVRGFPKVTQGQGAALANLDLTNARIFNDGACVVVSLQ
jgi:hypothetical protein